MDNSRSTLDTFRSTDTDLSPDPRSVARCARKTAVPSRSDNPDWEAPDDDWGLTTRRPTSQIRTSAGQVRPQQVRWVVDGDVATYVDDYGDDEVWGIPTTYSEFDDIETYVAHVDGQAEQYGFGLDGQVLEKGFRVLTGGGRYQASEYSVFPCGRHPWLLTGPEGTVLCSCQPVSRPESESRHRTSELESTSRTIEIEEENPQILAGASRFINLITTARDQEVLAVEYDQLRNKTRHSFHGEDTRWKIDASALATLGRLATDPSNIAVESGAAVSPSDSNREWYVEWDGPHHEVGSSVDGAIIAGYEFVWEQPADALERVATVRTYRVESSHSRCQLSFRSDRLLTLVPDPQSNGLDETVRESSEE